MAKSTNLGNLIKNNNFLELIKENGLQLKVIKKLLFNALILKLCSAINLTFQIKKK